MTLTVLMLAALLGPTRVSAAAAIPVIDVLSLSAYGVDDISPNDHVSRMTVNEPRPSCYNGGTNSAWYQITTTIKGQMSAWLLNYSGMNSIALYQGTSFENLAELSCVSLPPTSSDFLQPYMRPGDSMYVQVIGDGVFSMDATIGPTRFIDNFADA